MPEVFANTTPLQYLHRLGHLEWLRDFYGRVIVAAAVVEELAAGRRLGAKVPELDALSWIEIRRVPTPLPAFPQWIHRGEAEVLALALTSPQAVVIIDDLLARGYASQLGLKTTGTLGIILRAKTEQRIAAVTPLLRQLQAEGFHLAPHTFDAVRQL